MLSGLDPSGGAGIQADIQAITSIGAHPLPVLTCLTVQDTRNVYGAEPVSPDLIKQQLECLAQDTPIHAIKTGALGNAEVVEVLVEFVQKHSGVPLIVDPVIKAAGGGDLADDALVTAMKDKLFARAEMITPNGIELAQLGGSDDPAEAARNLLQTGCESVLATGGHGTGIHIINTLYNHAPEPMEWEVERVGSNEYHGTGCTLAAAIAAGRAMGLSPRAAISQAQNYVHRALLHALTVGQGQRVPDRGILWER
ncbi:MAG: bifunctional hydroxymethylpyrimidine kinase/phosphomethylpyrimidine kinase [Marinobacter nauticus]|uniref:bifunctional hydroxymethylpyrimidine kinase/phosphomethylpyrimidine kinase n=1 Tax=Marinobacter TaxID=2742 RepID=UPI0003B892B8|nr:MULTISPECIES: bifunctional hydroxymethylpyrimidine kinase/phosphomethylpyrimidine kinase [Marinobacter]ERS88426.1 phosphomethylpyrimidine kinase [Marinobacter sp. C1S70]MAH30726.1 bifunctional hydroxymethylpyrimidine kinase/phosphomethylpyrimidine kinase [Marinobacter sp.]MBY5962975.1 bifunctional hydroxymethylpyrimidine kinase/phosphomethylpyrimidine kinase [Marinobacter nauticus]TPW22367.1 bifunctional hydroxymethylpyrimidine kinase/phosphomethylpyrimidine kinase [Marinobacter nauticus]